jgi:hydrogenase expression/formation protein HypC
MCLGIPGQIVDIGHDHPDLAVVDVSGMTRDVNVGLLADENLAPGDWIVVHMGFALERLTPEQARDAIDVLRTIGPGSLDSQER